jgi:hypothetical protein
MRAFIQEWVAYLSLNEFAKAAMVIEAKRHEVRLVEERKHATGARPTGWRSVLTHTHTFSGKDDHGGPVRAPFSYQRLTDWAAQLGISAVGMGSPYTPESMETYVRYDEDVSGEYYRAEFDKLSVKDSANILAMLRDVNRQSAGRTFFYLDNETPKGRYGHMWWIGFHYDFPAWHDYDQPFDRWMVNVLQPGDYSDEPMPYERRPYMEIVASQRARGAVGCWAHPTSWWRGETGQFITNNATEMPAHAIADGGLDGLVIMGYHPFRPQYQAVWFSLLDRGFRVPGVAEMDCGLSDPRVWERQMAMLNLVYSDSEIARVDQLVQGFKSGDIIASSGPFVELLVDDVRPGHVARTSPDRLHRVRLVVGSGSERGPGRVELLGRGGEVLWSRDDLPNGIFELEVPGLEERGYLIARVFGPGESSVGMHWRDVERIAVSNPVYLHPRNQSFTAPAGTVLTLHFKANSPHLGSEISFETATGHPLYRGVVREGVMREVLPASGRFTLLAPDGTRHTHYLINANPQLQTMQRYLYRGRFLQDFPDLEPGELPPFVWQFDRYAEAMQQLNLAL